MYNTKPQEVNHNPSTNPTNNNIKYPTTIINSNSKFTVCMVHNMIQNKSYSLPENVEKVPTVQNYIFHRPHLAYYSYESCIQENQKYDKRKPINKSLNDINMVQEKKSIEIKKKTKFSSFYRTTYQNTAVKKESLPEKVEKIENKQKINDFILNNIKQLMDYKPYTRQQQQLSFGLEIKKAKKYNAVVKKQQIRIKLKSSNLGNRIRLVPKASLQLQNTTINLQQATAEQSTTTIVLPKPEKLKNQNQKSIIITSFQKQIAQSRDYKTRPFNISREFPLRIQTYDSKYSKIKYLKMNNCLNIILSSFDYYLDHPFNHIIHQDKKNVFNRTVVIEQRRAHMFSQEDEQKLRKIIPKYLYYIGYGNNAELIRSIFKKRNWWAETSDIQQAHVIWTQIKSKRIINKIHKHYSKEIEPEKQIEEKANLKNKSNFRINKIQICNALIEKSFEKSQKEKKTQQIPCNLFHPQQQKTSIQDYLLYFNPKKSLSSSQNLKPYKSYFLHNHYQKNYMFGNKNALYFNLSKYYKYNHQEVSQIIPLTYYLQHDQEEEINAFSDKFEEFRNVIWILKPGENTNRGQRIIVVKQLQQIKQKLKMQKKLIIQSYIKNLFLYDGRKFDIRAYMLALTINGRLKFYFYEEGYFRTSSELFNLNDLNDKFIHLTNDAIQKNCQNYGKYQDGNKISYNEFQRYLDNRYVKNSYSVKELHNSMKKISLEAVKATYVNFQQSNKFSFELFGLDFIVNSHFKPYLIQINTNPCLELSSSILERLIPRMLENMFRLSVDPLFRPDESFKIDSYYLYDESFLNKNKFHLIFDTKYDRNQEWQQYSKLKKEEEKEAAIVEEQELHD